MTPSSWSEARDAGVDRYFTGRPCKRGHVTHRRAVNGKCSECHRLHQSEWSKKNKDKVTGYLASWYGRNKEHAAKYTKAWHEARPNYSKIKSREWGQNNREYVAEQAKIRNKLFPEKAKAQALKRRKYIELAGPMPTADDLREIFEAQKGRCAYCKTNLRKLPTRQRHLDHIVPVAKGGTNVRSNLQFCCRPCNLRKNKKDPIKFAQEMGMLL